jgi:hypothetical protein
VRAHASGILTVVAGIPVPLVICRAKTEDERRRGGIYKAEWTIQPYGRRTGETDGRWTEAVWSFAPVRTIRMFGGMVIANGSKASAKTTAMCGISDLLKDYCTVLITARQDTMRLQISEHGLHAGAWGFMLASRMCRFEDASLRSSSLRLTHILFAVRRSIVDSRRRSSSARRGPLPMAAIHWAWSRSSRPSSQGARPAGVILALGWGHSEYSQCPGYLGTSPPSRLASGSVSSQGRWRPAAKVVQLGLGCQVTPPMLPRRGPLAVSSRT